MATGLETEYREVAAKLTEIIDIRAVLARLPLIAAVLQSGLMGSAMAILPSGADLQAGGALFNQTIADASAKAAAIAENMDGFDHAGFSGAVFAQQKINARSGR
jgi:hypothetical protein